MSNPLTNDDIYQINRVRVFQALVAAGITSLIVSFDGGGDEGQIHGYATGNGDPEPKLGEKLAEPITLLETRRTTFTWEPTAEITDPKETAYDTLGSAVEHLCYALLDRDNGGWENNEGGYGDFTIDATAQTIDLDMNVRIVSSESFSYEY